MLRDLDALKRAAEAFEREHGDEAQRRWAALGAEPEGELAEQQLAVVNRSASAEVWDALAWEVSRRIDLIERARRELDAEFRA
jgi:hypothetical protein